MRLRGEANQLGPVLTPRRKLVAVTVAMAFVAVAFGAVTLVTDIVTKPAPRGVNDDPEGETS